MEDKKKRFESYRVVHNCDIVPSVPFYDWGFSHVGKPIWLCKKLNNWSVVYLTLTDPLKNTGTDEIVSRPYGYSGSVKQMPLQMSSMFNNPKFWWNIEMASSNAAMLALFLPE